MKNFRSKGSLDEWVKVADILTKPGMEPFLFTLCCGFGAPLLRFSGFEGALVALVGKSGAGKTLTARLVQSIYGTPDELDEYNGGHHESGIQPYGNLQQPPSDYRRA